MAPVVRTIAPDRIGIAITAASHASTLDLCIPIGLPPARSNRPALLAARDLIGESLAGPVRHHVPAIDAIVACAVGVVPGVEEGAPRFAHGADALEVAVGAFAPLRIDDDD